MKHSTLLFLLRDDQILLAMKKRGFGAGRWNGVGGKLDKDETVVQAAVRECQEEIGVTPQDIKKVAHHTFILPGGVRLAVHTFTTSRWQGEPTETEEMAPRWFSFDQIPYDDMWPDDRHWLPHTLAGKYLVSEFTFDDNDAVITQKVTPVAANHQLLAP